MQFMKVIFMLIFCLLAREGFSQQVTFRHLSIDDGLSQNAVYSMLQDKQGFMWFGTKDGLNRYDGRKFVVYQHDPFDSTTISDAYVSRLLEDSRGVIWTGSLSGDINVFQRESGVFCKISMVNKLGENVITNEITDIAEGPDGSIWIATKGDGLFNVLVDDSKSCNYNFRRFLHDPADDLSLNSNRIGNLFFDENQTFWVGTEEGLNQFHESNATFTRTVFETKHPEAPAGSGEHKITSMHLSRAGDFWIGAPSGLIKFDRNSGDYEFYPNKYEILEYGWGSIHIIVEDHTGHLWLGTVAGLMKFDPSTKQYSYYRHDPLNSRSLSYNIISSLLIDKTGILWAGTSGLGINILDFKANRFNTLVRTPDPSSRIAGFSIRSILEDNSGDVWISADVLYHWNRETGKLKSFETTSDQIDEFGNTGAYSMIQASNGLLWFATSQGLFSYDPSTNEQRHYKYTPGIESGLKYQEVNAVFEDRDNSIWIATHNYFSILTNEQTGTFKHFRYKLSDHSIGIPRPEIFQDIGGIFWLGTADGLVRFDPETETFKKFLNNPVQPNSLSNNHIKSIIEDPVQPKKYLWVGTSGGLNKFDYRAGTFEHFTVKQGLPNEVVYGILPDDDGNLWFSTNKGLSRFKPETGRFRNFDVFDGLQSNEFNTGAYFKSKKSGELFFGGIQGLNYFYPNQIKDNSHHPPVVLTGIKLGNRPISNRSDPEMLHAAIPALDHITLSHHDDVITFEFAALDFSAPGKNQYAYMLEGLNEDWILSGNLASATFTNLPSGEYTFRAKGSNNDGIYNEEGLSLSVIVTPPWWHTWWAYIMYSFLFLIGLYLLRRYELNRFNLKNQLEFERVNTESLRKLHLEKNKFIANISHEFRTPLTLTLGPLQDLKNGAYGELPTNALDQIDLAIRNSRRLLRLVGQLMDLTRLENKKFELHMKSGNLSNYLKTLSEPFVPTAKRRGISFVLDLPPKPINALFDDAHFDKVIANLLSNAFKFTHKNGTVTLQLTEVNGMAEISIRDTGDGISEEHQKQLFDRFYQVQKSELQPGTGIGLSIAKELTLLHGGEIEVRSKIGKGSNFIVRISLTGSTEKANDVTNPYTTDLTSIDGMIRKQNSKIPPQTFDKGPDSENTIRKTILVVDDHSDIRSYLHTHLSKTYNVMEATNGTEAISIIEKELPDLIISDVMMPDGDGFDLLKQIRKNPEINFLPVILLTAKVEAEDKLSGLGIGANDYITKPFNIREILVRIENIFKYQKRLQHYFKLQPTLNGHAKIHHDKVEIKSADEIYLEAVKHQIQNHLSNEDFSVEILADKLNQSRSNLHRRLTKLTGESPSSMIRRIRIELGAQLLLQNTGTISEVAYSTGFKSVAHFSRVFRDYFDQTPTEFMNSQK
jgi:signal transduction histidine kinase/ligand-binding sensor domain-containing protein/DNA-binding response OmpR family regulator